MSLQKEVLIGPGANSDGKLILAKLVEAKLVEARLFNMDKLFKTLILVIIVLLVVAALEFDRVRSFNDSGDSK